MVRKNISIKKLEKFADEFIDERRKKIEWSFYHREQTEFFKLESAIDDFIRRLKNNGKD